MSDRRADKADVDYSAAGRMRDRCGACRYFIRLLHSPTAPGACAKVKGAIRPEYWCKLFKE